MKNWKNNRPDDWQNPWNDPKALVYFDKNFMAMRTADGTSPEDVMRQDRRDIYEAGADAMLEAIMKHRVKMPPDYTPILIVIPNEEAEE